MLLQNVGHHLVGAGRLEDLKQLLASPGWLERKLHSYGTASAVADFRRWGAARPVMHDVLASLLQLRCLTIRVCVNLYDKRSGARCLSVPSSPVTLASLRTCCLLCCEAALIVQHMHAGI